MAGFPRIGRTSGSSPGPAGSPGVGWAAPARRPRNDPGQYDDLADEWWPSHGGFAALHWLARARAALVPEPPYAGAPLLDVACGAGLLAPHLTQRLAGWCHVGVDLSVSALTQAREHGVSPVRGDALRLPFADGAFPCVVAGEVLEHLPDLPAACAELGRVLAPGGVLVVDTLAATVASRIALVHIAERLPGGPPPGIHDPALLVDPLVLRAELALRGIKVTTMQGLRPSVPGYLRWLFRRAAWVPMVTIRSTSGVYQAVGVKIDQH
jgi:2-polyprenyl-6-hydroxyphenyl methylase/3-demethylubiquinone-9 3-methyltransferase